MSTLAKEASHRRLVEAEIVTKAFFESLAGMSLSEYDDDELVEFYIRSKGRNRIKLVEEIRSRSSEKCNEIIIRSFLIIAGGLVEAGNKKKPDVLYWELKKLGQKMEIDQVLQTAKFVERIIKNR